MSYGNNSTTAEAVVKKVFTPDTVEMAWLESAALSGILPKNEKAFGESISSPIAVSPGQARSRTAARALANIALTGELLKRFEVTPVEDFDFASIDNATIAKTKNNVGAFIDMVKLVGLGAVSAMGANASISMYLKSSGARSRVGSTTDISSGTIILRRRAESLRFEVGMELDAAVDESTTAVKAYGSGAHGLYVMGVDHKLGTLTIGQTPSGPVLTDLQDATYGIPTLATGDWLFVRGDRNLSLSGMQDWLPDDDVDLTDDFFGVDRSVNRVRLAGHYLDATNLSISSALEDLGSLIVTHGGKPSKVIMSPRKVTALSKELGGQRQYVDVDSTNASIGYRGFEISIGKGTAIVIGDPFCPDEEAFMIDPDTWELDSVGKFVDIWKEDGNMWLRDGANGMGVRVYSIGNLRCLDPRSNGRVKLAA